MIFCEGTKNKSESAYFNALIKDLKFPGEKIELRVVDTKFNTGKELVKAAKEEREFKEDILWVVYDKDGYTQHAQTFDEAYRSNINIAFSSISFEFWILLHFEYTTRPYEKSEDIIDDLKNKHEFYYSKADTRIFSLTKNKIQIAKERAKRVQRYQEESKRKPKIFNFNPYTNIDQLIDSIDSLINKSIKQK